MPTCPDEARLLEAASGSLDAELEAHLDACAACRLVLAAVVTDGQPPARRTVDRYEIESIVGAGGMGVVYAARDPRLHRRVAVKLLKGARLERLQREGRVMAQLAHPNVVSVFDTGEAGGRVFVAMELCEGGTLRGWLSSPRPEREVLRVLRQAGEGLAAAHDAGIVHRDFKPENVLLGADGRARVSDFGLAHVVAPEAAALRGGAVTGPAGTLAYMAPEQLEGRPVDARADQYAFCVTLYEALSGHRPETPPRPLDSAAWPALRRGLSAQPSQRFPSMRALLEALEPPPARRRWPWALAGGLALLLAAVLAWPAAQPWEEVAVALPVQASAPVKPAPVVAAQEDTLSAEARELPLPAAGTRITLAPGVSRVFVVEGLTVARIDRPDVVDVEGSSSQLLLSGLAHGEAMLTLEFGRRVQRWPLEVRSPVAEPPQLVALQVGEVKTLEVPGLTRVTLGDATIVDLDGKASDLLRFNARRAGVTNALVWTEDARRLEFRFDVSDGSTLTLTAGLQRVLSAPGVQRATITPPELCEVQVLGDDELLLLPYRSGEAQLTLEHRDGTAETRPLRILGK